MIFHIQHLWPVLLAIGSNFAPFEEVKVPVSNSADLFLFQKCLGGFGVVRVLIKIKIKIKIKFSESVHYKYS